jgi:PAS domain-containing protein
LKQTPRKPRVLAHAPSELTAGRLRRLGEGIGKVVYTSGSWVVKRERTPSEVIALILVWKILRAIQHLLPWNWGESLLQRPSKRIRLLRVLVQGVVLLIPRGFWYLSHIGSIWRTYHKKDIRGQRLADAHLSGTCLVPERIAFPPTRVEVGGWPGFLTVSEATERVEATLHQRLSDLARAGLWVEVELWLRRFLDVRLEGWQQGLFSTDAHLKNYGVTGTRVVLLDAGGLTDKWSDVEDQLAHEQSVDQPHRRLGLATILEARPDIAARFDEQWRTVVSPETVRGQWPAA